jgi:hypothetical protein
MRIYDIDKLIKFEDDMFYDVSKLTFQETGEVGYLEYKIQKGEEMRIDLVCKSIYNNVDYVDILLSVNRITNPLNIKEGVVILYPPLKEITNLRYVEEDEVIVQEQLANPNKATKADPNRKKYVEENYSLPPTVLNTPTNPIQIDGDNIKVGKGLFNR